MLTFWYITHCVSKLKLQCSSHWCTIPKVFIICKQWCNGRVVMLQMEICKIVSRGKSSHEKGINVRNCAGELSCVAVILPSYINNDFGISHCLTIVYGNPSTGDWEYKCNCKCSWDMQDCMDVMALVILLSEPMLGLLYFEIWANSRVRLWMVFFWFLFSVCRGFICCCWFKMSVVKASSFSCCC